MAPYHKVPWGLQCTSAMLLSLCKAVWAAKAAQELINPKSRGSGLRGAVLAVRRGAAQRGGLGGLVCGAAAGHAVAAPACRRLARGAQRLRKG